MNLLIFGATGSVGCLVVEQAPEKGHMVTAFVRNREKLDIKHENLKVVKGDVMDTNSVEKAVQGKEAVVCVLRAGKKILGTIRLEGTQQIIKVFVTKIEYENQFSTQHFYDLPTYQLILIMGLALLVWESLVYSVF